MSKKKFHFEVIKKYSRPARDAAIWAEREALSAVAESAAFVLLDALVRLEIGIRVVMSTAVIDFAHNEHLGGKDNKKAVETMDEIVKLAFQKGRFLALRRMQEEEATKKK